MAADKINLSALYRALGATANAQHEEIGISIFVDVTSSPVLVETIRRLFMPDDPGQVTLRVEAFGDEMPQFGVSTTPGPDVPGRSTSRGGLVASTQLVVVVAGTSPFAGAIQARCDVIGIPCVTVCTDPARVSRIAEGEGMPISPENLLFLEGEGAVRVEVEVPGKATDGRADAGSEGASEGEEPLPLGARAFAEDLGGWIVDHCRDRRLAFAHAFRFVRRPLARETIRTTSAENALIGAVFFIPGADLPIMTLNQVKMVLQIAAAYGQEINLSRAKEIAVIVAGGFVFRAVARQLAGLVPGLGWAVKGGIGYSGTMAMGRSALDYFESGGDMGEVASKLMQGAEKVAKVAIDMGMNMRGGQEDDEDSITVHDIVIEPMVTDMGMRGVRD